MLDYRLYQLNGAGRIVRAFEISAQGDDDAIAQVALHPEYGASELWRRDRVVRLFTREAMAQGER